MIETPLRPRIDLSADWDFRRKRVGRRWLVGAGGGGETVSLPHCWNTRDTFQYGRRSYSGWGAYRRIFEFPENNKHRRWSICSGGFYGVGDLWLDGKLIAKIDGQYLGFGIDLDSALPGGAHTLGIRLDNRWRRDVLPGYRKPDFILHGGLAAAVWLERTPDLHFDLRDTQIVCSRQPDGHESVSLRFSLVNKRPEKSEGTVDWTITRSDGALVATSPPVEVSLKGRDSETASASVTVQDPRMWSPGKPNLYWAEGRLSICGEVTDVVRIRFGITHAEFRPRQGFFLDGQRVDLRGCNRHEAIPGFGNALPENLHRRDAEILKDLGCNFVRLSHYPQSPAFLDACDELGLLVYSEIATWKSVRAARGWRRAARRQMNDLIVRDRHHPSIILWGMGNESRSHKTYLELRDIANNLDPTRAVTYAENHLYRAQRQQTTGISDVWGVNYELDVLEDACAASRLQNVVLSECCNHPHSVRGDDQEELAQVLTLEREWEIMASRPYLAGHTVWCLTDYATEHRRRYRRLPGLCDAWRQPKMAADLFRARYSTKPFVSLFVSALEIEAPPSIYRREQRPMISGGGLFLHVFSNCDGVRLSQNGAFLALLEGAFHHVVEIDEGFSEIIATGSRTGKMVQANCRPHGQAARVEVANPGDPIKPGQTIELDISVRDSAGLLARNWSGEVHLEIEGLGRLHCFTEDNRVEVARGIGRVYFTPAGTGGHAVVFATADGLASGSATLSVADL